MLWTGALAWSHGFSSSTSNSCSSAQQTSYVAGNSVKVKLVRIGLLDKILELNLLAMLVRT
jgi:hypothetical protein